MTAASVPRWAISFADLGLLLLGCFVLLHAIESSRPKAAAGGTASAAPAGFAASELFEPGEARLKPRARAVLHQLARRLPAGPVRIVSRGAAEGSHRLDRFELAAARAASVARTLREGGRPERDLVLQLDGSDGGESGQRIAIAWD